MSKMKMVGGDLKAHSDESGKDEKERRSGKRRERMRWGRRGSRLRREEQE